MLTGPGKTALWVCLSWQSPRPHLIPGTNLRKAFQRGSALLTGPKPHRPPMLTRNCLLLFLWILVDEGSVFSSRPPLPPLGQSRKGREHARSSAGPMRNGANRYQRVKRGWVWNQFFVLEEYMGSDPQYVGKVKKAYLSVLMGCGGAITQSKELGKTALLVNGGHT